MDIKVDRGTLEQHFIEIHVENIQYNLFCILYNRFKTCFRISITLEEAFT